MTREIRTRILEEATTRPRLNFINSLRVAILSILFIAAAFLAILADAPFSFAPPLIGLALALVLSSLGFRLFNRIGLRPSVYLHSLLDILVSTIIVYYSGGISSPFYFLYILPIIICSMFLQRRDTLYIATFSYIIFGILADLIYLEILPYFPLMKSVSITLNLFVYNLVMAFFAFSSTAILSSFYFDRIRRTGAELHNARENLRDLILLNNTVLERMENGFIITDANGVIISYNEKSRVMLNFSISGNLHEMLDLKNRDGGGNPAGSGSTGDSSYSRRCYFEYEVGGLVMGVSYSIIENIYSFSRVYVFIITDLTEKREIEKKLQQKERLALIGEMSAGIAHEIRNPLASISGSVQFLNKELDLDTEYRRLMDIIVKESTRLSNSIEVFLEYAKTTPPQRTDFDLAQVLDDVAELTSLNHPEVMIRKNYQNGFVINADIKKMNQVVWNLINNAVKAVNEKGEIRLTLSRRELDVCMSVADNGVGIDSDEMSRIFTPFYSRFSSGIGLGMAMVKRIADEHHFDIYLKSEKNMGTEVTICCRNT